MPTYGYQCNACGHEFSVFQSMKDDPISVCPECAGSVKRLLYPVGIVFKGSGWYVNDSRKPEPKEKSETKVSVPEKTESTSETKTTEKSDSGSSSEPKKESAPTATSA